MDDEEEMLVLECLEVEEEVEEGSEAGRFLDMRVEGGFDGYYWISLVW